jgi:hypothetical protein
MGNRERRRSLWAHCRAILHRRISDAPITMRENCIPNRHDITTRPNGNSEIAQRKATLPKTGDRIRDTGSLRRICVTKE